MVRKNACARVALSLSMAGCSAGPIVAPATNEAFADRNVIVVDEGQGLMLAIPRKGQVGFAGLPGDSVDIECWLDNQWHKASPGDGWRKCDATNYVFLRTAERTSPFCRTPPSAPTASIRRTGRAIAAWFSRRNPATTQMQAETGRTEPPTRISLAVPRTPRADTPTRLPLAVRRTPRADSLRTSSIMGSCSAPGRRASLRRGQE